MFPLSSFFTHARPALGLGPWRVSELRGHLPPCPHPPPPHAAHTRMLLLHSPTVRSSKSLAPLASEYNRQKTGQRGDRQTGNEKKSMSRTE